MMIGMMHIRGCSEPEISIVCQTSMDKNISFLYVYHLRVSFVIYVDGNAIALSARDVVENIYAL